MRQDTPCAVALYRRREARFHANEQFHGRDRLGVPPRRRRALPALGYAPFGLALGSVAHRLFTQNRTTRPGRCGGLRGHEATRAKLCHAALLEALEVNGALRCGALRAAKLGQVKADRRIVRHRFGGRRRGGRWYRTAGRKQQDEEKSFHCVTFGTRMFCAFSMNPSSAHARPNAPHPCPQEFWTSQRRPLTS